MTDLPFMYQHLIKRLDKVEEIMDEFKDLKEEVEALTLSTSRIVG